MVRYRKRPPSSSSACSNHHRCQGMSFRPSTDSAALSKDMPPFVIAVEENMVAGLNVIGLRRAGFSAEERAEIRRAFRLLYESGLNVSQALAQARAQTWSAPAQQFFDFVAAARRGIPALRRTREAAASDDG